MGFYINPEGITKERWLDENAKPISVPINMEIFKNKASDEIPLCLVDNGAFTALGVCFNPNEMMVFNDVRDGRIKFWYMAKKEDVKKVCCISDEMMS